MSDCVVKPDGKECLPPSGWATCPPYSITDDTRLNCYSDMINDEQLQRSGAVVNVFKLLGVHEQTKLVDLTGQGQAISGGSAAGYPASNAFNTLQNSWRSSQTLPENIRRDAYIGYDFGVVRIASGRERYGIPANVRQHITALKIQQGSSPDSRATRVRVERSDDNKVWYGVAAVDLPNNDSLNTIAFKQSVPSRYWRLRPTLFTGGDCAPWVVTKLQLYDYVVTQENNIQDFVLLENRNRDYNSEPNVLRGFYEINHVSTDLTRLGMEIPASGFSIRVNFNTCVASLGRPIVIGDIVELPSERQYDINMNVIRRYLEVTDVTWDSSTYSPGWQPTMLFCTTKPALASEETQNIFGDLVVTTDDSGLLSGYDGNNKMYQDLSNVSNTIRADALTGVPERGSEGSNVIRKFTDEELERGKKMGARVDKMDFNPYAIHVEDAIPQNGADFTEGPTLPTNPVDGAYHRLTYVGAAKGVPTQLRRWSEKKKRWITLEIDRREMYNAQRPTLASITSSPTKIDAKDIR